MDSDADETPVLLIKKYLGMALLFVGLFLTALGLGYGPFGVAVLGMLLLAAAVFLFALKIIRRNRVES